MHLRCVVTLTCFALLGCHHTAPARAGFIGQSIGNSNAIGAEFLSLDPVQGRLQYRLRAPAFVILLEVSPGNSIHLIAPSTAGAPAKNNAGLYVTNIHTVATLDDAGAGAEDAFQACYANGVQAATPRPVLIPAKRDKNGKIIEPASVTAPTGPPPGVASSIREKCLNAQYERLRSSSLRKSGERYLVLLASNVPMNSIQLLTRLEQLNVVASDVRSTIEAIALGLFASHDATWSGCYTSL